MLKNLEVFLGSDASLGDEMKSIACEYPREQCKIGSGGPSAVCTKTDIRFLCSFVFYILENVHLGRF